MDTGHGPYPVFPPTEAHRTDHEGTDHEGRALWFRGAV